MRGGGGSDRTERASSVIRGRGAGLRLTTRHQRGPEGGGGTAPYPPPPPPGPPPPNRKDWAEFSSGHSTNHKFSLVPSAPISLDRRFSSAPQNSAPLWRGRGCPPPPKRAPGEGPSSAGTPLPEPPATPPPHPTLPVAAAAKRHNRRPGQTQSDDVTHGQGTDSETKLPEGRGSERFQA